MGDDRTERDTSYTYSDTSSGTYRGMFFETAGRGRRVLFLHGWGCDGRTLRAFAEDVNRLYAEYTGEKRGSAFVSIKDRNMPICLCRPSTLRLKRRFLRLEWYSLRLKGRSLRLKGRSLRLKGYFLRIRAGEDESPSIERGGICAVLPDLWGFGKSRAPENICGVEEYAALIAEFLKSQSEREGEPITVIAHSFGARIAVVLAAEYPRLTEKIVLIGGAGLRRFSLRRSVRVLRYKALRLAVRLGFADRTRLQSRGSADFCSSTGVMRGVFLKVIRNDLSRYAKKVDCRTLLIYGEKDRDTPLWIANRYNRLIKNSELRVIPNAAHFVFTEKQYETAKLTARFIADNTIPISPQTV